MSISQANALTTGSKVYYKDLVSLQDMAATVASITPNKTLTVSVTTPATSLTWSLAIDGTVQIPVYALN